MPIKAIVANATRKNTKSHPKLVISFGALSLTDAKYVRRPEKAVTKDTMVSILVARDHQSANILIPADSR